MKSPTSPPLELAPMDRHNQALLAAVHPPDWINPEPAARYHLVVIGAGTAGLVTAAGAAGLGARVALVERHLMGGDCLNVGCVPSKCLIRSSRLLGEIREAEALGIPISGSAEADFPAVMERMRRIRARLSGHDSADRFKSLGVDVFLGEAGFAGPDAVEVAGKRLRFRRAVIATGARPAVPSIPGLAEAGCLTNETVFNLTERPDRLAVIGGGPVGCELAQAFRRLGSQVVLLHHSSRLLNKDEPEAGEILERAFVRDGIRLALGARILRVERSGPDKRIFFETPGSGADLATVDEILCGTGRIPNLEGLNLEAAGVAWDPQRGVRVDDRLRTTHPRIYAAGDVCLRYRFTHAADAAARIVIQNALFRGRKRASALVLPWCTYTDPEIAHVGMTERDAEAAGIPTTPFLRPLGGVDRAVADGEEEGFVKVLVRAGTDRIVGATIVARHAGEMINEITLAMTARLGLGTLAGVIHPYPTQAEAIKQAADAYQRTRLTPFVKKVLGRWLRWTG